jgi:hypothetical protein
MIPMFADGWENFIVPLVLLAVSALSAYLNKRRQKQEEQGTLEEMEPPATPQHQRRSEPVESEEDLQEALRRALGMEPPPTAPPPPPILPPVIAAPRTPVEVEGPVPIRVPLPQRLVVPTARPVAEGVVAGVQQVHAEVPVGRVVAVARAQRRHSRQAEQVRALIRNPQTVRSAFVISQVFGPPKALESQP